MRLYDIIKKKRDGGVLTREEIEFFVQGYAKSDVPDYQASALLVAIYFKGMNLRETKDLTKAMMNSGEVLDLSSIPGIKVDKHSTGGVGDKVSLVLAPLVAAAGVPVPMISGRGLGHTGGTLDKLESIPNFRTDLSKEEFVDILNKIGVAMMGQSPWLAPADGRLYALRDVTATVDCIPLIASSIMSKKMAEGINALVLDVKTGSGAFMKDYKRAVALAEAMVNIGKEMGKKTVALITDMDQPLGRAVGNALEVIESIETVNGRGPKDLEELTMVLGSWMLVLGKKVKGLEGGRKLLKKIIDDGRALDKFRELVKNQGGDVRCVDEPGLLPRAGKVVELPSPKKGYIQRIDAERIGIASTLLGAGRERIGDKIDHAVGIVLNKKVGEKVEKGEPLALFHVNDNSRVEEAMELFLSVYRFGPKGPAPSPLIKKIIK